jgi:hypothetical protein
VARGGIRRLTAAAAGVGTRDPAGSWAALLARRLHWNAFVYGVPRAGYVHAGLGRKGPVAAEID